MPSNLGHVVQGQLEPFEYEDLSTFPFGTRLPQVFEENACQTIAKRVQPLNIGRHLFGLIDSWDIIEKAGNGRMVAIQVMLSEDPTRVAEAALPKSLNFGNVLLLNLLALLQIVWCDFASF
jgi:hypothetical protein